MGQLFTKDGVRLPTSTEAEDLAMRLLAAGYPPDEAVANFRHAFPDGECEDGCLMFEGPSMPLLDATCSAWCGMSDAELDTGNLHSWLNAVAWAALLTIVHQAGERHALGIRDAELAYAREHW